MKRSKKLSGLDNKINNNQSPILQIENSTHATDFFTLAFYHQHDRSSSRIRTIYSICVIVAAFHFAAVEAGRSLRVHFNKTNQPILTIEGKE